jgi:hypothetical protein
VVGAIWAYWRFARERTRWPRAILELVLVHRQLTPDAAILNVKLKVHNAGRGLMQVRKLRVDVHQVLPLAETTVKQVEAGELVPEGGEAEWPCIQSRVSEWAGNCPEIEPEENDEFGRDFLLDAEVETVFVYAYLWNAKKGRGKHELGWPITTFYDLAGAKGERRVDNLAAAGGVTMSERQKRQQEPKPEPGHDPDRFTEQQEPRPEPAEQPEPQPLPETPSDEPSESSEPPGEREDV